MTGRKQDHPEISAERLLAIHRVLDDVIERRISGDTPTDREMIEAHPELMPELADELENLRVIERARIRATSSDPTSTAESVAPSAPDLFPGYTIIERLDHGGQGVVYRARQDSTGREVAIKVPLQGAHASEAELARLSREVQILGALRHPGVVRVLDSGYAAGGSFYYVMEYIEGASLQDYLRERRDTMSVPEIVTLLIAICDAVSAAHLKGVIHRDIKPANIRIDEAGLPHLLDFGLAKLQESPGASVTHTGQFVGSLQWSAPEQATGQLDLIDTRTDVFALGVVGFHMLTGQFPYDVIGSTTEIIERIAQAPPKRPSALRAGVDHELETILLKCMSKEQERRYGSAGELAADLRRYQANEPVEAKRDSSWYLVRKTVTRHRAAFAAGLAFFVLLAGSAVSLGILYRRQSVAREAEAVARREAETVAQFLVDTLGEASPRQALGEAYTVRQALDHASERIPDKLNDTPLIKASVHAAIGNTYFSLGDWSKAKVHLDVALRLRENHLSPDHPQVAVTLLKLADIVMRNGDLDEASRMARRAVEIRENHYGEQDKLVAMALANLGTIQTNARQFSEARSSLDRALGLIRTRGIRDFTYADIVNAMAMLEVEESHYAVADRLFREAEEVWSAIDGPKSIDAVGARFNIASVLTRQGKYGEAENILNEVLPTFTEVYGPDHPDVAMCLSQLASIAYFRDDTDKALTWTRRAIETQERILGPEHPKVLELRSNLASVHSRRMEFDEEETILRDIVQTFEQGQDRSSPMYISALEKLGRCLESREKYDEAESIYRRVLDIKQATLETGDPQIAITLSNIGSALESAGDIDAAEDAYVKSLEGLRGSVPPTHPALSGPLGMLGRLYLRAERFVEAEPLLRECAEIRKQHLPTHWLYPLARVRLAASMAGQGRAEEAEPLLSAAWDDLNACAFVPDNAVSEARASLYQLYDQLGRPDMRDRFKPEDVTPAVDASTD